MNIRDMIGNLFIRLGVAAGANPSYIPHVKKIFDAIDKRYAMYYDAASRDRLRNDWTTSTNTPYSNMKGDLKTLIARSRESTDNNGLSENIDNVFLSNVVHTGIKPAPVVRNRSGELDDRVNKKLDEGWKRYNDQWDRSSHSTYYENQGLGLKTIINSGSVLRNTVPSAAGDYLPIANQLIEPDRLDFSADINVRTMLDDAAPGSQLQFGIYLDPYGRPEAFKVNGYPSPVPASNMDIRYRRRRTEQFIGVPWKAPVLTGIWDIGSLIEDRSIASRIQAMIALWVNKKDAPRMIKNVDSNYKMAWEPGRVMYSDIKPEIISSGEDVSKSFDPLTRLIQRNIAIGTGLSYQILTKDLQGMNFAASRANILEDRRIFRQVQKWFIKEFCQVDWQIFVKWMFLSGKMAPFTYADYLADPWKYNQCYWQPPGWDWVDPLKDAKAAIELNNNNMLSLEDHYGEKGKRWDVELEKIAREKKKVKELEEKYGVNMSAEDVNADAADAASLENAIQNILEEHGVEK